MRAASVYSVECICGRLIESEPNSHVCPGCHRLIIIEWPAAEEQPDNISALPPSAAA